MLDLVLDFIAPQSRLRRLRLLPAQAPLEEKVRILMQDIAIAPWEKIDPLVAFARTLEPRVIPQLLLLYSATSHLRLPINRAQKRKGGISVCDEIDTIHHFFYFALETYRGYPVKLLDWISRFWDDYAARIVRGKPDHEDLLANRLGMQWGAMLKHDPVALPSRVIRPPNSA